MSNQRIWSRRQVLDSPEFLSVASEMKEQFEKLKIPYALIGGLAVAHYANPPVTVDIDILVQAVDRTELLELGRKLSIGGWWNPTRLLIPSKGNGRVPFGVILSRKHPFQSRVDLLGTGMDEFLNHAVETAIKTNLHGDFSMPVISAEDLVIMKILAGREKDIDDALLIQEKLDNVLDKEYIEKKLNELE